MAVCGETFEWARKIYLCQAWASGSRSKSPHWKALPVHRVIRAIVGLDFLQTEPHALRELAKPHGRLKVISDCQGTFHPKLIVAIRGSEARAIVGSSNFTVGGYGGNTELNLFLHGAIQDTHISDLIAFIEDQWNRPEAFHPTDSQLVEYEKQWRAARKRQDGTGGVPPVNGVANFLPSPKLLNSDWGEYFRLVLEQHGRLSSNGGRIAVTGTDSYLTEAKKCRETWRKASSFAQLDEPSRQLLGGYGPYSTGYFGNNSNSPPFTGAMRSNYTGIAAQLDLLPCTGSVSLRLAKRIMSGIVSLHGLGLGTASRLMTACRPDLFFTVNSANLHRVKQVFKKMRLKSNANRIGDYMSAVEQVWASPWWRAPKPDQGLQKQVWVARAALLDALFYEADQG